MQHDFSNETRRMIADHLASFDRRELAGNGLRPAAVAIVVTADLATQDPGILLTLRPQTIKRHSGQYALPGGRLDTGETAVAAALRELDEELGVTLGADTVLGTLDDYATRSGFCITPVVIWGGANLTMTLDPGEVASVHHLPFGELLSPDIPRLTEVEDGTQGDPRETADGRDDDRTVIAKGGSAGADGKGPDRPAVLSCFFPTLGHYVFAPTAALIYQFREVALRGRPTRVAHFDQPGFAWK